MQVWLRGDTATSARATHWDGQPKTTSAVVRVGGTNRSGSGAVRRRGSRGSRPGHSKMAVIFRPGAATSRTFRLLRTKTAIKVLRQRGLRGLCAQHGGSKPMLPNLAQPVVSSAQHIASVIDPTARVCAGGVRPCKQKSVDIFPARPSSIFGVVNPWRSSSVPDDTFHG